MTCGGYPGLEGHYQQDIATFASWGIDMLKVGRAKHGPID
jgi:hypothetical protein